MLLSVKLKLTRPFLGDMKPDSRGVRCFKRQRGRIFVNSNYWKEQFQIAAKQLQYDVDVDTIVPPTCFEPATIHLFPRRFSGVRVEMFEAFRGGTVLTMDFIVREDLPKAPTPDQFRLILAFTGEHLGLSPFGSKFNMGRFEVDKIEPKQYAPTYVTQHEETRTTDAAPAAES